MIDYVSAVNGGLRLVPVGPGAKALADDYSKMIDGGLLLEEAEPFEALMERCADIAARANSAAGGYSFLQFGLPYSRSRA